MTSPGANRLGLVVVLHAVLALGYAGLLARDLASRDRLANTDFAAYATGAALAASGAGARLYDEAAQSATQAKLIAPHRFPGGLLAFLNPPHAALALRPFARLDFEAAARLWIALQLALAALAARTVARIVGARAPLARAAVLASVGAFWPLFYALQIGQLSPLLLVGVLGLYLALEDRSDAAAGAWLVVLSLKPQLLPLFAILLATSGRTRALAWAGLFGALTIVVTGFALGFGVWTSYFHGLLSLERFFAQGTPEHMTSLRGLLSLAFGATTAVARVSVAALVAVAAALGVAWGRRPLAGDAPTATLARRFAVTVGLALAFSPHLFAQDLALWIAPLAIFWLALDGVRREAWARFALAWPLAYVVVAGVSGATGWSAAPLSLVPPVAALVLMARWREGGAA